eukprot:COSAG05_NODE_16687_length_340_cov_1351.029046_1_plen_43_part_00
MRAREVCVFIGVAVSGLKKSGKVGGGGEEVSWVPDRYEWGIR